MPVFELANMDRNVIAAGATDRVVITNTSDRPVVVVVDIKGGSAWRPLGEPIQLAPEASWSAGPAELGGQMVRVTARGQEDGRPVVRVEY